MGCAASSSGEGGNVVEQSKHGSGYETIEVLGKGAFGKVVKVKSNDTGKEMALKVMVKGANKAEIEENRELFKNEHEILARLDHPNILKMHRAWETKEYFNLLTDLCDGGELYARIVEENQLTEKRASEYARTLLYAMKECHDLNVCHRDLKPENLVYKSKAKDSDLVLIDFGCAIHYEYGELVDDMAGTPYYVAPEVLDDDMDKTIVEWKAADVWSLGIVIYVMVTGSLPFTGEEVSDIFESIKRRPLTFPRGAQLSTKCKDMLTQMLTKKLTDRPSVAEVLEHPWILEADDRQLESHVMENLEAFHENTKLRRAVGKMMAAEMTPHHREVLETHFKKFDTSASGQLSPNDIALMLRSMGHAAHIEDEDHAPEHVSLGKTHSGKLSAQTMRDVKTVMDNADEDGDGRVSIAEFVAAESAGEISTDQTRAKVTFNQMDMNNDGKLSAEELHDALHLDEHMVKDMLKDFGHEGEHITFDDFLGAMEGKKVKQMVAIKRKHTTNKKSNLGI